jgi:hypothetical protein
VGFVDFVTSFIKSCLRIRLRNLGQEGTRSSPMNGSLGRVSTSIKAEAIGLNTQSSPMSPKVITALARSCGPGKGGESVQPISCKFSQANAGGRLPWNTVVVKELREPWPSVHSPNFPCWGFEGTRRFVISRFERKVMVTGNSEAR